MSEVAMSKEDLDQVKEIVEDASFRVMGVVAFMLGQFWAGVIFFLLLPVGMKEIKKFFIRKRIAQLERVLAQ
jgi:arginine exporter protein ArgO